MDSLAALLGSGEHPDSPALRTGGEPTREYDHRRLSATARRTGNLLRHLGVREGETVAVADDPAPEAVLTLLGTALLGGTTRFGPPRDVDVRVLVAPTRDLDEFDLSPGGQRLGYGSEPADPSDHFFERDVWSENPAFPPTSIPPDAPVLTAGDGDRPRTLSHGELLAAAQEVAADLDPDDTVAVRAPLAHAGAVAAGIVAPLLAGACIVLPDRESAVGDDRATDPTGTVAVVPTADSDAPEPGRVLAGDVL